MSSRYLEDDAIASRAARDLRYLAPSELTRIVELDPVNKMRACFLLRCDDFRQLDLAVQYEQARRRAFANHEIGEALTSP